MRKSLLMLFLVCACEERPVQQPLTREQILQMHRSNCAAYGYKENTDAMAQCIQTENALSQQRQDAHDERVRQIINSGMLNGR